MKKFFLYVCILFILIAKNDSHGFSFLNQPQTDKSFVEKIIELIKYGYINDVDDKKLYEYAVDGILGSLDPHSAYLTKEEFDDETARMEEEFGGIGIEIIRDYPFIRIISPIEGTPAYKAGIKAGDYIVNIDGKSLTELTYMEALKMIYGKKGTKVKLTILRSGESKPLVFNITRDIISTNISVTGEAYGNIMYLRIIKFTEKTTRDFNKKYQFLLNKIGRKNVRGIVLDLRNNPGGLLEQSVSISEMFLKKDKKIVTIKGKNDNITFTSKNETPIPEELPLVILVNNGSASASEIVAGALQDNGRGVILGTKSFGKGSVQTLIKAKSIDANFDGAIKITTALYYTPNGKSIQANGIIPDIIVENNKVKIDRVNQENELFVLAEKDLKNHLKTIKDGEDRRTKDRAQIDIESIYEYDYQLAKALEWLNNFYIYRKNIKYAEIQNK